MPGSARGRSPRCRQTCASRRGSIPASRRARKRRPSWPVPARISSISRARRSAVLPAAMRPSIHWLDACSTCAGAKPRSVGPHHLALAHRNAARNLRDIFPEPDADEEFLRFRRSVPLAGHPFGVGGELTHGLDIGREPGQPMGRALLAIEQPAVDVAFDRHPLAHFRHGIGKQGIEGRASRHGQARPVRVFGGTAGRGN